MRGQGWCRTKRTGEGILGFGGGAGGRAVVLVGSAPAWWGFAGCMFVRRPRAGCRDVTVHTEAGALLTG